MPSTADAKTEQPTDIIADGSKHRALYQTQRHTPAPSAVIASFMLASADKPSVHLPQWQLTQR